jgi:hypothetical protein
MQPSFTITLYSWLSHINFYDIKPNIYIENVNIENIKFIFILYEIYIIDIVIYLYYKFAIHRQERRTCARPFCNFTLKPMTPALLPFKKKEFHVLPKSKRGLGKSYCCFLQTARENHATITN